MRAVLQRVIRSSVDSSADGTRMERTGSTELGLMILLGVTHTDGADDIKYIVEKSANMRLFPKPGDEHGFDRSVLEVGGSLLLVSQFTLYASTRKGRRPSFTAAAPGEVSEPLFESAVESFRSQGLQVSTGVFGAYMHVELVNDGPVTILLDSNDRNTPRKKA